MHLLSTRGSRNGREREWSWQISFHERRKGALSSLQHVPSSTIPCLCSDEEDLKFSVEYIQYLLAESIIVYLMKKQHSMEDGRVKRWAIAIVWIRRKKNVVKVAHKVRYPPSSCGFINFFHSFPPLPPHPHPVHLMHRIQIFAPNPISASSSHRVSSSRKHLKRSSVGSGETILPKMAERMHSANIWINLNSNTWWCPFYFKGHVKCYIFM